MISDRESRPVLAHRTARADVVSAALIQADCTTESAPLLVSFCDDTEIAERFAPKRTGSILLADSYSRLGFARKSERVSECGSWLEFAHEIDNFGSVSESGRLHRANFCRDRLCPMCSWRRSLKIFSQVSRVMDSIQDDYKFLFLTLTVPNCSGSDLGSVIADMFSAWSRFTRQKDFKKNVCGFFRALEITRNPVTGMFHPHFHCILAVHRNYGKWVYVKRDRWLEMWQRAMRDYSISQVDIRVVKPKGGSIKSAVAETAKYTVKSSDYLLDQDSRLTDSIVSLLVPVLASRRLSHMGGIFADTQKQLNLGDPEDGDLVNVDSPQLRSDVQQLIVTYGWTAGAYKITSVRAEAGTAAEAAAAPRYMERN